MGGLTLAICLAFTPGASAHDFSITDVIAVFKADGSYTVEITCDLDALALGVGGAHAPEELAAELRALSPEKLEQRLAELRALFGRRVRIRFDGHPAEFGVSFPDSALPAAPDAARLFLGQTARLSGRVPREAREATVFLSRAFGPVRLVLVHQRHGGVFREMLAEGQESRPFPLLDRGEEPMSRPVVAWQYLRLGFEHILPKGLDHILFVTALFLLSTRLRSLLWQVTAFTLAHTSTLALAMCGIVTLPSSVVEPLIALSIAYAAVENLMTSELRAWRPAMVFGFGLLHGLGFAEVLTELGVPRGEFTTALISFNVGVELGQLAVIALALVLVGWWRRRAWYRARIVIPASAGIAAIGLYWAVQRTFGL